jgi:protoheme ferro-lyase
MRYWNPFTEEAIERIKRDHIKKLVILPLYPQFSISTSGSSFRVLEEMWQAGSLSAFDGIYSHPLLVQSSHLSECYGGSDCSKN